MYHNNLLFNKELTLIGSFRSRLPCGPVGPDLPPSEPLSTHLLYSILCILLFNRDKSESLTPNTKYAALRSTITTWHCFLCVMCLIYVCASIFAGIFNQLIRVWKWMTRGTLQFPCLIFPILSWEVILGWLTALLSAQRSNEGSLRNYKHSFTRATLISIVYQPTHSLIENISYWLDAWGSCSELKFCMWAMYHCQCFAKTTTKTICLLISNHFLNHLYSFPYNHTQVW